MGQVSYQDWQRTSPAYIWKIIVCHTYNALLWLVVGPVCRSVHTHDTIKVGSNNQIWIRSPLAHRLLVTFNLFRNTFHCFVFCESLWPGQHISLLWSVLGPWICVHRHFGMHPLITHLGNRKRIKMDQTKIQLQCQATINDSLIVRYISKHDTQYKTQLMHFRVLAQWEAMLCVKSTKGLLLLLVWMQGHTPWSALQSKHFPCGLLKA